jgi:hypothetical protein
MFNIFKMPFTEEEDGTNIAGAIGGEPAEPQEPIKEPVTEPVTPAPSAKEPEPAEPARDLDKDRVAAAARREAESQAKSLKDRQDNFAKQYGYNSFEELEYAQQVKQYTDQGVDPAVAEMKIRQDKLEQQIAVQGHQTRIQQEKASLQNQRFYKDLEPEIDATLRANPSLGVRDVFDYIKGKRMDDLLKKETAAAKQKTMNDINGKSHIRSDGGSVDNDSVDVDPEEFKIAKALNPKETSESYRAWKKSQK